MGRVDRLLQLDDERELPQRASLWKRALWRGLKNLARHHPRAAITATLSALGYAGKQAAVEVVEGATTNIRGVDAGAPQGTFNHKPAPGYQLDDDQKRELVDAVSAEDLKRLAQLAKKDPEET